MRYYSFYLENVSDPIKIKQKLIQMEGKRVIFDADNIICKNQIYAAINRAERAKDKGVNIANDWAIEVLLHLVGTHQIKEAFPIVNVTKSTDKIVIIQDSSELKMVGIKKGLPKFQPDQSVIDLYGLNSTEDPCKEIISKGVSMITNYE